MKIIGITGGVGAGKSELLAYIKEHYSCEIYLADLVAHEVEKRGTDCYHALVRLLGEQILGEDGEIDKRAMAAQIFSEEGLLQQVNDLVHPAVRSYLLARMDEARSGGAVELFFVEAALLIECGYHDVVDEMWYVYATQEIRVQRLKEHRGYTTEKALAIMKNQLSEEAFREGSDFMIDNSGDLEDSFRQIDKRLEGMTWHS